MEVNKVAVAVNSKKSSRSAVTWALENLVSPSDVLTLVHVCPPITSILTSMGYMHVSRVDTEVVAKYMLKDKIKTDHMLKTFTTMCDKYEVNKEVVVLTANYVQQALVKEINKRGITKIVLGASSRNCFTKMLLGPGLPESVSKSAPDFCSVYIVSEHELDSLKESKQRLKHDLQTTPQLGPLPAGNTQQRYRTYTFNEILEATNNLSADCKLGEGGYGVVYKGKLDHLNVAIKVLKENTSQGIEEFQHEVKVLSQIHHPHMILLMGCCPEKACLVYEYMANGSLQDRLKCHGGKPPLPWFTRFRIAAEVATALHCLHGSKPEPIVHRDVKPGNILLDQNLVSKLGDVGLARLITQSMAAQESTYFIDTRPIGTYDYIDPEYQQTGSFGPKSDVFALGVVLLQLLTGKQPQYLIQFVKDSLESGSFADVLDQTAGDWPLAEATQVGLLAVECCSLRRRNRPHLEYILPILDKIREDCADMC